MDDLITPEGDYIQAPMAVEADIFDLAIPDLGPEDVPLPDIDDDLDEDEEQHEKKEGTQVQPHRSKPAEASQNIAKYAMKILWPAVRRIFMREV